MTDPLREPTFLILAALAPQPLHGYAIIGEVADLSGGRLALRAAGKQNQKQQRAAT